MAGDPTLLLAATASAFVALLMLRAALDKAADGVRFEGVLADYDLVPDAALRPLRIALPVLELLAAGALSFGVTRMAGAGLAGVLLLSYACAMGLNLTRGRSEIDCGCGGPAQPLHWALVARNLCLTATLTPTSFEIRMVPVADGVMSNDPCGTFTLTSTGLRGVLVGSVVGASALRDTCWR